MTIDTIKAIHPVSNRNQISFKNAGDIEERIRIWVGQYQPVQNRELFSPRSGAETSRYGEFFLHPLVQVGIQTQLIGAFSTGWSFVPGNDYRYSRKYEEFDKQIIKDLNYQVDDSNWAYDTFEANLFAMSEYAMGYGFEVAEKWKRFDGNYVSLQGIKTYEPPDFDLYSDDRRMLKRIQYRYSGQFFDGIEEIEPNFVVATYPRLRGANYYGWSTIQPVLHDLEALQILEQCQTLGIRALAVRPIIHWYLANAVSEQELNTVRTMLINATAIDAVSLPSSGALQEGKFGELLRNHQFDVLDDRASHDGVELIKDAIDFLQKRILRTFGIPDDLGFTTTTVGSLAKASEEMNIFLSRIRNLQKWVESVVNNQIIPTMIKYNYSFPTDYIYPKFQFNIPKEEARMAASEYLQVWYDKGVVDEHYVQEVLSFPERTTETAKEEEIDGAEKIVDPSVEPAKPIESKPSDNGEKKVVSEGTEVTEQEIATNPDLTLNGAQIASAMQIVQGVSSGMISRSTGLGALEVLLNLSVEQAEKVLGDAGIGKPTVPIQPSQDKPLPTI